MSKLTRFINPRGWNKLEYQDQADIVNDVLEYFGHKHAVQYTVHAGISITGNVDPQEFNALRDVIEVRVMLLPRRP